MKKYSSTTDALGVAKITTILILPEGVYVVIATAGNGCATSIAGFLPEYDPTKGFAVGNVSFDSLRTDLFPTSIACGVSTTVSINTTVAPSIEVNDLKATKKVVV